MNTKIIQIGSLSITYFSFLLYTISFAIPLLFSSPQIITGTIINCLLFLSVYHLRKNDILPMIFLPSLGAIMHGVLFGPQTIFLFYYLPFIWLGNYILISIFSHFINKPYLIRVIFAASAKYLLLQVFAQIYFHIKIVPSFLVSSMGYIQLVTAVIGGFLSYFINMKLHYERR